MNKLALGFVVLVSACAADSSSDGPEVLPELTVPPKPTNGLQALTPIVRDIQPGSDNEICTWTDAVVDHDVDVKSTQAFQTAIGHHVVIYYTTMKEPPGTQRVCTDTDMASFRYLTGNGHEGEVTEAPGDLIFRIPAGSQIVINHHYLNASDQVFDGQAVANINFAEPGKVHTPSGALAFVNTDLDIQPGIQELEFKCKLQDEVKLWYLIPHMHRWGKSIQVDLTRSGVKERMFDTEWNDEFTFHPPEVRVDPTTPLVLAAGDEVAVHCTWNNDTGKALSFGFEMCVSFAQFVDDKGLGNLACDNGNWTDF